MKQGSLSVVGTGYRIAAQVTPESLFQIQSAEKLFYVVADAATELWLQQLNPTAESLHDAYAVGKPRIKTYREMVRRILTPVRQGERVCVAFYGHPGIFAYSTHEAVKRARKEGFRAAMLPGISALDCLFADLGVDPSEGCQIFDATRFVTSRQKVDKACALILWQVGAVGVSAYKTESMWSTAGLELLREALAKTYPPKHKVVLYEAPYFPVCDPLIQHVPLAHLQRAKVTIASTLYVPPAASPRWDSRMAARLGLDS